MSQSQIERNILNAVLVLRTVHRETDTLIVSLDNALAGRGWRSLGDGWLGLWQNGAKLAQSDNWMATILNGAYANPLDPRLVILVEIYLAPANGGPPVIAMAGLSLAPKSIAENLWEEDGWEWPVSGPWFNDSVEKLDSESMRRVVPKALHGRGRLRCRFMTAPFPDDVRHFVESTVDIRQNVRRHVAARIRRPHLRERPDDPRTRAAHFRARH